MSHKTRVGLNLIYRSGGRGDRASASGLADIDFDSEFGQTNDLKIGIHSFLA